MNRVYFIATPKATKPATVSAALRKLRREAQTFQDGLGLPSKRTRKISNPYTEPGKGTCVAITLTVTF